MSKEKGYILVYRDAFNDGLCNAAAWIDIIQLAEYKDGRIVLFKSKEIELKRGQVYVTIDELLVRWTPISINTTKKVRGLLNKWERQGQIERVKEYNVPIITIVNYDLYQGSTEIVADLQKGTSKGTSFSKKGTSSPDLNDIRTISYEECKNTKGTSFSKKGTSKGTSYTKININKSTTTAPAYAYEENLFALLAQDSVWLEAMAMNFCSELPTKDEQLQALYDAIRELRKQYYLDGKHHESVSDLKQHLRLSIKSIKRIKESESNGTSNKQHPPSGESKSERRRPTPPSHNFTESF